MLKKEKKFIYNELGANPLLWSNSPKLLQQQQHSPVKPSLQGTKRYSFQFAINARANTIDQLPIKKGNKSRQNAWYYELYETVLPGRPQIHGQGCPRFDRKGV